MTGTHPEPAQRRGSRAVLEDHGEIIGSVLRPQDGVKPLFVSLGHRMDLATAARLVLECAVHYRLPEPTRLADRSGGGVQAIDGGVRPVRGTGKVAGMDVSQAAGNP